VTDFATGQPIQGATISLYRDSYTPKRTLPAAIAIATTDQRGIASLPGTKTLDPHLNTTKVYGFDKKEPRFFILTQKGQDRALLPLDGAFRVYIAELTDYSLYPWTKPKYGHIHTWGTTAQGLYKAGDTVQYKIYVRNQDNRTLIPAPRQGYALKVIDPMGKVAHQIKKLNLSEFGSHHGQFTLPKKAAVGWYNFQLTGQFGEHTNQWQPLRILVSDFTPSIFRVKTEVNKKLYQAGDPITIDTTATYHAGGPYAHAPTRIQAILTPQLLRPSHPAAAGFTFDVTAEEIEDQTLFSLEGQRLNSKGQLQTTSNLPARSKILYGQLKIESAVKSARSKKVANMTTARYIGRDRFIGLKETSWVLTAGKKAKVLLLAIDQHNQPIADTNIEVKIERRITKGTRVKSAGNAYLTHYEHHWEAVAECHSPATASTLDSESAKAFSVDIAKACTFIPPKAGAYKVTASIKDTQGRPHSTELHQWATGPDHVLWETVPGHTLTIIPEQQSYKVGETARYMIKNPYPGARALITIERLGTMKSWVQTLKDSIETIEVPVEPDYIPGYFVSVTVMSPRVADKPIKDQVDLGKPAFRMGYVKTNVKDPYKELVVNIQTDKAEYRPREQVTLNLKASPRQKDIPAQPIELAVTVLDESVFDLLTEGREYFDPYKGFYTLDDLDITNYSLLMRLVGRQKFEKKGANAGGDGGSTGLEMRTETDRFVSYWNPSIKTDTEGKAQIQFTLPDNLTGWRVLAMAVTPSDRMGLGDSNFKVNKPIEIYPVMPNQLTSGDSFLAGFSVRNTTDKVRELEMTIKADGPIVLGDALQKAMVAIAEKADAENVATNVAIVEKAAVSEAKAAQTIANKQMVDRIAAEKVAASKAADLKKVESEKATISAALKKAAAKVADADTLVTERLIAEMAAFKKLNEAIEAADAEKSTAEKASQSKSFLGWGSWFSKDENDENEDDNLARDDNLAADEPLEKTATSETSAQATATSIIDEKKVDKLIVEKATTMSATNEKVAEYLTLYQDAKAVLKEAKADRDVAVDEKDAAEKDAAKKLETMNATAKKLADEVATADKLVLSIAEAEKTAIEQAAAMKAIAEKAATEKAAADKRAAEKAAIVAALSQSHKEMIQKITKAAAQNAGDVPPSMTTTITAHPSKRYTQWLPLKTTGAGTIHFTAKATDGTEGDALVKTLQVLPHRPSTTAATYGSTIDNVITEFVQFPKDILSTVGGLKVIASPTVIGGVEGAFEYMRDYPYACWEQKLSKGTMASHYNNLHAYLADSLVWENSQSLPDKTIGLAKEYQAPNGGMAYFIAKDERVSPYLSAYTASAFNWLRSSGHRIPETVENDLHNYLLKLLRKDVMPNYYSKGMASSVRASALAALAQHGKITRQDINRYKRHVKRMDLFGKSQFLSAALQIPGTGRIRTQVADMILAHANQTSGSISFTETLNNGYKRMLSSSLRTQCAILDSLSQYDATMSQRSNVGSIPFKLVRHITKTRKSQGHWENTQENMYCMNALVKYARVYEKDKPSYQLTVNSEQLSFVNEQSTEGSATTKFDDVKNPPVTFTHKMTESDPGTKATIKLEREGQGRLYYTVRMNYAEKAEKATAINAGIQVNREYHVERDSKWVRLTSPMEIKKGELVRIDLYVSLPAPRHFVVVDDPIPGGLEPLNRDLATTSKIDADKADGQYATGSLWFSHDDWEEYGLSWWSFYHKELRHHAARFYSDYLSAGNYHLSYVATAIASGKFSVMATHVEEMYEPEIFGKSAPATLKVVRE
jgi:uncharacterized protein YfaS (alpha-2-macroglobulin family)